MPVPASGRGVSAGVASGLCDRQGESALAAARRELAEETGTAAAWSRTLIDLYPSPGVIGERVRIFLARELRPAADGRRPDADDGELPLSWTPLVDAVRQVYAGEITNGLAVAGLLAAAGARTSGYAHLRKPDG